MKLYIITGTNMLTGETEVLTSPLPYSKTRCVLQRWLALTKDCQDPAWIVLKVKRFKGNNNGPCQS